MNLLLVGSIGELIPGMEYTKIVHVLDVPLPEVK